VLNAATVLGAVLLAATVFLDGQPAKAAGVTTHWMISETVLERLILERPGLATLLIAEYGAFRRGTVYPDAAQSVMKDEAIRLKLKNDKWPHGEDDNYSHDYKNHAGIVTQFLKVIRDDCGGIDFGKATSAANVAKTGLTAIQCRNALSYLFGMVSHIISDAPWHATWIGNKHKGTLGKACPKIPNDWSKKIQPRHNFADLDIDLCLASRLNGNPLALNTVLKKSKAAKLKTKAQFLCPKGQFPDVETGACYSCPKGYTHNPLLPAKVSGVCHKPAHTDKRKGRPHGQSVAGICPVGQFVSLYDGKCYSCDKDFAHNPTLAGNKKGVCYRTHPDHKQTAKVHEKIRLACGAKAFPDLATGACYTCPSDAPQFFPQYKVSDERVCQKRQIVHCDMIELPALNQLRIIADPLGHSKLIARDWVAGTFETAMKTGPVALLKKAYHELGYNKLNVEAADARINDFYISALKEPLTPLNHLYLPEGTESGFSKEAGKCSWAFTHLFDPHASGSIPDSAKEVVKFIVPMWDAIVKGEKVDLKRTGSFVYSLEINGKRVAHYP
jgi:hypothetical protein